ncbi:MAG: amidohydrolase family protein [Sphingomonadales bacterium]|jgi:dihydroorotase|nr:amidohydrolase family protein [Sphingomonadales bacterium]
MTRKTAIINARIVGRAETALLIEGDRIAHLGDAPLPADAELIDAKGAMLAPALIDLGVFAVDKAACIAGGIARIALMPDQNPVLDEPGIVQRAALAAKPDLWVHPLAAATRGLKGQELAELALMQRAGAKAVSTGRGWIADSGVMAKLLIYAASLKLTVISHAEDGGLTAGAVATSGETATRNGLPAAPAMAEAMALARDLALVRDTGARLHVRQITTGAALDLIRQAKRAGLPVTCGVAPTHWLLTDIALSDFRTFTRLSPPLRSEADRQAVLAAIADGTIDVLTSSHDPRGPEAKRLPFVDAEPGAAGAETLLPLALGLVRDGVLSMDQLFEKLATNPARILGLDAGVLAEGAPADLVLFNPDTPWQIRRPDLKGLASNTPFDGLPVQGRVLQTIKGGQTLA